MLETQCMTYMGSIGVSCTTCPSPARNVRLRTGCPRGMLRLCADDLQALREISTTHSKSRFLQSKVVLIMACCSDMVLHFEGTLIAVKLISPHNELESWESMTRQYGGGFA